MKLHWGHYSAIILGLFMAMIITYIVLATREENLLKDKDYYESGLKHDEVMEAIKLREDDSTYYFKIAPKLKTLSIGFSDTAKKSINLNLYRPNDLKNQRLIKKQIVGADTFAFSLDNLEKGFWEINLKYERNGNKYLLKDNFMLE